MIDLMERLFINGMYAGRGHWIDTQSEGDYTVEYVITGGGERPRVHTVKRVFLKAGGGVLYEEHSTVTFEESSINSLKVTIGGAEGSVSGKGYWFDRMCHYEAKVKEGNHLEFTFVVATVKIEGMGSATNSGNFTSWKESVSRVN
jgi:hypothetical protein